MNAISLFACGGIGDVALERAGFNVLVANELLHERAQVFEANFPNARMIVGDIWEVQEEILRQLRLRLEGGVLDMVFATPPCQGMSKNGRGKLLSGMRDGTKCNVDPRNLLVVPTVEIFLKSGAHTLVMENVPEMASTVIPHPHSPDHVINIIDFIKNELGDAFVASVNVVEFADYGVPQRRQRLISVFSRHPNLIREFNRTGTLLPPRTHSKNGTGSNAWVTVRDAIGHLPPLDAGDKDSARDDRYAYHRVPLLEKDKYFWVSNTPPEKGAFDNQCANLNCRFQGNPVHGASRGRDGINRANLETPLFCSACGSLLPRPWVREEGKLRLMKGYTSAYKRMSWSLPSSTLTRNLSYACSDNKVHPEQNRVLSLLEAMILHTVDRFDYRWERKDGKRVTDKVIRELIGESIPPAGLEKIFMHIAAITVGLDAAKCSERVGQRELEFVD